MERGAACAVAIDPTAREARELGLTPAGLELELDAIIDAGLFRNEVGSSLDKQLTPAPSVAPFI